MHYGEVFERVVIHNHRPPIPEDMSAPYTLLMSSCWAADPLQRPGFDSVLHCIRIMLAELGHEEGGGARGDGAAASSDGVASEGGRRPSLLQNNLYVQDL